MVSEFNRGDLTQVEFCRRQGLVLSTLGRYLRRERSLSKASQGGLVAVELAAKKLGSEPTGCGLSVMVGRERRIVVESDFDAGTLQRLVEVLEAM
jgi:small ligand-binding sensory domain FIST